MLDSEAQDKLAKQCYYGYGSVTDFKNFQGNPMPEWEQLPGKIQEAWKAAARYAFNEGYQAARAIDTDPDHK